MNRTLIFTSFLLGVLSCAGPAVDGSLGPEEGKADHGKLSDVDWANQFFLTQIHDSRWNPNGRESDSQSNNCGPASFAMLMASQGTTFEDLDAEIAIDHARAMMYAAFPEIDEMDLAEGASLYEYDGLVCVDDDDHSVFFDLTDHEPSLAQGIFRSGVDPVFGYSWSEVDSLLQSSGAVIAYGHITEAWVSRFSGTYGSFEDETIPHFILVFPASTEGDFIVCDPMHKGGAELMERASLQTFFKSPINVYDTTIRVIAMSN